MADVVMIMVTVGFFALCSKYVSLCDRIIGSDADSPALQSDESSDELAEVLGQRHAVVDGRSGLRAPPKDPPHLRRRSRPRTAAPPGARVRSPARLRVGRRAGP